MTSRVRIEYLVLEGLPLHSGDSVQVQAAIQAALQDLVARHGLPAEWRGSPHSASRATATLQLGATPTARELGAQLGAGIHDAIAGGRR